ncbi:MAG: hypothetical protein L0Y71_13420 [Gemmataceae bacterium]|nr:hypothetical protein [Gemmataceae bacterium]
MNALILRSLGALVIAAVVAPAALGQWPRPPRKDLAIEGRALPIPFKGHNYAYCNMIAFSKDGTLLATGAESNLVVWDIETGKIVSRMQMGEKQYAVNVAFTDDGKTLVSNGQGDPMIRFWDVKSGKQKSERPHANAPKEPLPPLTGKGADERRYRNPFLAFGPGARLTAVLDATFSRVEMVDTATGAVKQKLNTYSGWRGDWAFSPDGKRFATSAQTQLILHIWNAETGDLIRTMSEPSKKSHSGFTYLRFSHDGKFVFAYADGTGQNDHCLAVWGVDDGLEYCRIPIWCSVAEMSPDGRMLVGASGGRFFVFDLLADRVIENVKLPAPYFYHVQRSPDGKSMAFLGGAGTVNDPYAIYLAPYPLLGDDAPPEGKLSAADLADLWKGASSANLFRRRYVTKVFQAHAEQAVALVAEKVKPAAAAARLRVLEFVKGLDDDDFERRDAAMKELRGEAFRFEPLLRDTVKLSSAGEIRNRVTFVLNGIKDQPTPAGVLSDVRGVELLEALATAGARKLLESLASGAAGARTTREAEAALKRLESGRGANNSVPK